LKAIPVEKISDIEPDVILIAALRDVFMTEYLLDNLYKENPNIPEIEPFIKISYFSYLKELFLS